MAIDEFGLPVLEDTEDFTPVRDKKRVDIKAAVKKGQKLFKKAQSAGKRFVAFRNEAKKAFGELEGRSTSFNLLNQGEPQIFRKTKKQPRRELFTDNINPFGQPTNESIGLLRSPTPQRPISERLKDVEKRMGNNVFANRAKSFEESFFGIKRNERGQATIEAIFAIFVFAVIGFAILPLYYQILNSFLIPAIENEAFGSLQVLLWQIMPVILMAGMAFSVFQFFKPKIRQV